MAAWVGAAIAALQLIKQMRSQQQAEAANASAQGLADVQQRQQQAKQGAAYQSTASQMQPAGMPEIGGPQADAGGQRLSEISAQNQQNQDRLRALQQGTSVADVYRQTPPVLPQGRSVAGMYGGMAPVGQGQGAPPQSGYPIAGTQAAPSYSLSTVPQTTESGGLSAGQYAQLIGAAAEAVQAGRPQTVPGGGFAPSGSAQYQPTALQLLAAMQQRRRFY